MDKISTFKEFINGGETESQKRKRKTKVRNKKLDTIIENREYEKKETDISAW